MSGFSFADRYAQASIAPGPAIIAAREAPADRILKELTAQRRYDLVDLCYESPGVSLDWFRDEFLKEDASFSLINNRHESVVLAAAILGAKVDAGDSATILAILTASVGGKRQPTNALWLLEEARRALPRFAVSARRPDKIETKLRATATPKLGDELSALPQDGASLSAALMKVRSEAQEATRTLAVQTSAALSSLVTQMNSLREETQMLWWLFGEHSRALGRHLGALTPGICALVAGFDLGDLTTASALGPVAAPAMLERVLGLARKERTPQKSLSTILDALKPADLEVLDTAEEDQRPRIFPIMTAVQKAKENGSGSWQGAFAKATGLDPKMEFEPLELAIQTYYEHLLGQLE